MLKKFLIALSVAMNIFWILVGYSYYLDTQGYEAARLKNKSSLEHIQ